MPKYLFVKEQNYTINNHQQPEKILKKHTTILLRKIILNNQ